jgi:hypothetical protein
MKRLVFLMAIAITVIAFSVSSCKKEKCGETPEGANAIAETSVPQVVRDSFNLQYPSTTATWYLEGTDYEAAITVGGAKTTAIYSATGVLQQVETEIAVSALPSNISAKVNADYSGYTINTAATILIVATGQLKYEAEVENSSSHYDLIYDSNAVLLEKVDLCAE